MSYFCHRCGKLLDLGSNAFTARNDECPSCRSDLHVCLNCKHFERGAYNDCRESQAERVVEKDRRNFCDYFSFGNGKSGTASSSKSEALKKLDDIFK